MTWVHYIAKSAPEIFLLASIAIGTLLGRIRIRGFALGATACILLVSIAIGQLDTIAIPPVLRSVFFGFFVFTIGYRSGPEFFASLSLRTLNQVALSLFMGACGLAAILLFARLLVLDPGTAAGLGAGALTQSSMIGTAVGALAQLGHSPDVFNQQQANVAAGYAVTYISGYILVLLFVPFVAPLLMGVNLRDEAAKLEASMAGTHAAVPANLAYHKFQVRAFCVAAAGGRLIREIEQQIGRRTVIERILRNGQDVPVSPNTMLKRGDDVLVAGPSSAIVAVSAAVGPEIEAQELLSGTSGRLIDVYVTSARLHGRTLADIAADLGGGARGVFLNKLTRHGREVPLSPETRIYVSDVMTLVGIAKNIETVAASVGEIIRASDRTDVAFVVAGLAIGLLFGLASFTAGSVPLTLGGAGGALIAGLVWGWLRSRKPILGSYPAAAQQTLSDIGLGAFIAAIGLTNGPAALAAIQAHGFVLLGAGIVVTLAPMILGTVFAHRVLHMNPVIICGALAGAMTVDAAVSGSCEVAKSQTPVLGVAVPYAMSNVVLTVLGPIIVALTFTT
jgi:aspartate-alanine antiporter